MLKIQTMKEISIITKIVKNKEINPADNILVIGLDESLLSTLPKGSYVIDSSFSKIKNAHNEKYTFETKDLKTFNLNKKFSNILSLNTLHLEDNLKEILARIYHHLTNEAVLYFPLAPNNLIDAYLKDKNLLPKDFTPTFQYRTRTDIETAALETPFNSILIEEKTEFSTFYSKGELIKYLKDLLPTISSLQGEILQQTATDLAMELYREEDKILTLPAPWILLTLSCEETLI